MNLESMKGIDRGFGPLPDITQYVVELIEAEAVNRAGRIPVLKIDVAGSRVPPRLIGYGAHIPQAVPFVLARQADRLSGADRFPVAECLGLKLVNLHRPVPGEINDLEHGTQPPAAISSPLLYPEQRMRGLFELAPVPAFLGPPFPLPISAIFHELQVFTVGNQITGSLEPSHLGPMQTIFVVPSIQRMIVRLAELDRSARHRQKFVAGRFARLTTDIPRRMSHYLVNGQLPDQHGRGFQVDTFMLDPHHDSPERAFPGYGHGQRQRPDQTVHTFANLVAVLLDRLAGRPVVVGGVKIVPGHFVHSDRKH